MATDLKDLEPLSKRLNAASNELTQALQTIQDRLNALNIGVEVWLEDGIGETSWRDVTRHLDDDGDDVVKFEREFHKTELGYGRLGDGWALLVRVRRIVESEDGSINTYIDGGNAPRPLLRSSREDRVAAVPALPELIDAIEQKATSIIERVEQAKKIAEGLK